MQIKKEKKEQNRIDHKATIFPTRKKIYGCSFVCVLYVNLSTRISVSPIYMQLPILKFDFSEKYDLVRFFL